MARIAGVSDGALRSLGEDDQMDHEPPSTLALIAARLHGGEKRKHVHSTAYVCDDDFGAASTNQGATTIYNQPSAFYRFDNPNHSEYGKPEYSNFKR